MMKTNNVIITLGANNAVAVTEKSYANKGYKSFTATTSFISALKALDYVMDKVSNNDTLEESITTIHVPDMLKGFAMGSFREYLRTNKTSSNRAFTEEEIELVKSIATKMMNKGFNLIVKESKYFPKDLRPMKDFAINVAKELKTTQPAAQTQAPVAPAKSPVVAKLEELMAKALDEGDFDAYDKLEERYNKLTNAAPVVASTPVVEEEEPEEELNVDDDIAELDC